MITDADGLLAVRFDALRENHDDADWADVLQRRGPQVTRRTRRLIAAFAVIAVAVPSSFAFGGVRGFFFGAPAPPLIAKQFAQQNAMRKLMLDWERTHHQRLMSFPEVNGHKAHGVMAVDTKDGLLMLWAAPAAHGKQCWFVDWAADQVGKRRATGEGSCDATAPPSQRISWGYGWSIAHPTLKVLSGRLYVAGATSLTAFSPSGTFHLPVVHAYFLAAFPKAVKLPTKLVARNATGEIVATWTKPG